MRRIDFCAVLLLACALVGCGANSSPHAQSASSPKPTTGSTVSLSSLTANNTSAASGFANQSNGNLGANNVSKLNVHSLLYSGATTKILAHMLLWFGGADHMNVGYNSNDANQVQSQIEDMISRGIDGVVIDWYGPNNTIDQVTKLVQHQAEQHPGFTFAIMIDAAAMNSIPNVPPQQALTQLMQYVEQTYFTSSAYMTINGQPVVTNFNIDNSYSVDWAALSGALHTPPRFFFQDNEGFSHPMSDGSYSWVMPQVSDYALGYLSSFYDSGLSAHGKETVGATYKGFNDTLASWGTNRVMSQQCGGTWLQTFSQVNNLYNSGNQLPYLQLVTWNDYEEGTEIESGIDNCFSLQPSVSANTLQWSISGSEDTIDHYTVYTSTDGQNLTDLTDVQPGTHSVNLCSFPLSSGKYQVFVQAVGKPMMANRMPAPVSYSPSCGG